MSWLMAALYDRAMHGVEEASPIQWRTDLLRELSGDVLEIGAGTGANLPLYHINRYDADLHQVRQIRVTFRVQTGVAILRGPAGVLFSRAGTGRPSDRLVPDQAVQFDVTPRNLNLGR